MLDFRKYNFGLSITILFFISDITMAQYCIDQSNYTQWLCNNVKGAQQACSVLDLLVIFQIYLLVKLQERIHYQMIFAGKV